MCLSSPSCLTPRQPGLQERLQPTQRRSSAGSDLPAEALQVRGRGAPLTPISAYLRGGAGRPPLSRRGALRGCAARGGGHGAAPVKRRLAQAEAPLARPHPRRGSGGGRRTAGRSLPPGEGRPPTGDCAPPLRRRADSRRRPPAARPAAMGGCHSSGAGDVGGRQPRETLPAPWKGALPPHAGPSSKVSLPEPPAAGQTPWGRPLQSPAAPHGTRRRVKGAGSTRRDGTEAGAELSFSSQKDAATPKSSASSSQCRSAPRPAGCELCRASGSAPAGCGAAAAREEPRGGGSEVGAGRFAVLGWVGGQS